MRKIFGIAALLLGAACGNASAEEQFRVASAAAAKVTAQARVNISVTVTHVMSLRLGSPDSTLAWANVARGSVRCTVGDQNSQSTLSTLAACNTYALGTAPTNATMPISPGALNNPPTALVYTIAGI